jgi:hypothetical protein
MSPSEINRALNAAKLLRSNANYGTAESLMLAYVAWEGLKVRILIAGLAQQGWQQKTFKAAIIGSQFWKARNYNKAFRSVFGKDPEQIAEISKIWKEVNKAEAIRSKYVHGLGQTNPKKLLESYDFLVRIIEDHGWLENLKVILPDGKREQLVEVFKTIRASRGIQADQSVQRLKWQLGFEKKK